MSVFRWRTFLLLLVGLSAVTAVSANVYPARFGPKISQKSPYNLVGQVFFTSGTVEYIGSGTIIGVRSVLTAGHNVYDAETGWSTGFEYYRATYGDSTNPVRRPSHRYLFAGYQANAEAYGPNDVRTFSFDSGGLSFATALDGGKHVAYSAERALLLPTHYQILLGYGAEGNHDGDYPLYLLPSKTFHSTYGNFYENTSIYIEGGMSGGPLFSAASNGLFYQVGIIVSGSTQPVAGGVRMLNPRLVTFITTYLP